MILDVNERRKRKSQLGFPDLLEEGKKYGLSNQQISNLIRYLNDKRLLKVISLEQFKQNAQAWFAALTGIVAEVLAMDAHVSIWVNKKLERPRNWILSKINSIIPTKIDDIAMKAITIAQQFTDDTLLPLREKVLSSLSSKMHDRYQYHSNANHLGYSLQELKEQQKARLKESEVLGKEAITTIKRRQAQANMMHGLYKDDQGYFHDTSKYKGDPFIAKQNARRLAQINERIREKNETKQAQEVPEEGKSTTQGNYP